MNKKLSALIIAILSISVVIFYLIYPYLAQLETPSWVLEFTFYALMTAIFGFIFLGILAPLVRERLENSNIKKLEDKELLEALKNEYSRCAWSIEQNIKGILERNERSDFTALLYKSTGFGEELEISEELERQVQEYNRRLELYRVLHIASERWIGNLIDIRIKLKFPKSLSNHVQLRNQLTDDYLRNRYLNGEKVTENWFKDSKPEDFKKIVKNIEESERDTLDVFFHELNKDFKDDEVLQRFREEKEELIKHGKETIANLQKEADSISEQLKKYSNLRTTRVEER